MRGGRGWPTHSRKGVAQWELRKGDRVGVKAVLRGREADRFRERLRACWERPFQEEGGITVAAVSGGSLRITLPTLRRFQAREAHYDALQPVRNTPVTVYRTRPGGSSSAHWRRRRSLGRTVWEEGGTEGR